MDIIDAGALNRSTGTTSANADSSRSHAVLQLSLRKDVGRVKNKEHGKVFVPFLSAVFHYPFACWPDLITLMLLPFRPP